MTPNLDQCSAARILDLAVPANRPRRWSAIAASTVLFAISAFAAHEVVRVGSPDSAQAVAMSPAGATNYHAESREMKKFLSRLSVAGAVAAGSSALAQDAVQWRVEDGGNGHWYQYVPTAMRWHDAQRAAESRHGYLACLASAAESTFVRGLGVEIAHLGGFQQLGSCEPDCGWTWLSGEPWSYSRWAPTQPDNGSSVEHVLELDLSGNWNDYDASGPRNSYIIEWSADCNDDGIVDFGQIRAGELADADGDNIPDCCELGFDCRFVATCWPVEIGGNGHWYEIVQSDASSTDLFAVRASVTESGADLASISSEGENDWIKSLGNRGGPTCRLVLGGFAAAGPVQHWFWVDGTPWTFSKWNPGEPDSAPIAVHVEMLVGSWNPQGRWIDAGDCCWEAGCSRIAVEWSADCNGDGVVDYGQIRAGELVDDDGDFIPDRCECTADVDGDTMVNSIDLGIVLAEWGTDGGKFHARADVDGSGTIDAADLAAVLFAWGACP